MIVKDYSDKDFTKFGLLTPTKLRVQFKEFHVEVMEDGSVSICDNHAEHIIYFYKEEWDLFMKELGGLSE